MRTGPYLILLCFTLAVVCHLPEQAVAQPDIVVAMTGFPASLEPGDWITYTIFFNNTGPDFSALVWINLTMPNCLVYMNDTSGMVGGVKTGDFNWTFQPVLIGNHSFSVWAELDSSIGDMEMISSEAHLDYWDTTNVSMPSSFDTHISIGRIPQISPEISFYPPVADPGDVVNITINLNNTGSALADSVLVDVTLPGEISYLSDNSALEGGAKTGDYNWSFSSLVPGEHRFNVTTVLATGLDDGTSLGVNTSASFSNTNGIWFQGSGSNETLLVVAPIMEISKSANSSLTLPGELVGFVIDVRNVGGGISKDVWVNDTFPESLSFIDSFPEFESFLGNTYTFHFTDFPTGMQQIFIQARVNDSAPVGESLTNIVVAEFTDANGNPVGVDQAQANVSVVQARMNLEIWLPSTETTPGDSVVIEMRFQNEMTVPSKFVWMNLTIPEHMIYLSDTSFTEGGIMTQTGKWLFSNVSAGNHSFEVVLLVDNQSQDGSLLTVSASMVYTNQFGVILGTVGDIEQLTVRRPEIDIVFRPENVSVRRGDAFELSVYFNNTGSRASQRVWINATLPTDARIVDDTSSEQGGTREGTNFTFENVDIGLHGFQMVVIIDDGPGYASFSFEFGYLDSDGDFLSASTVSISAQLLKDERFEFPIFFVIGIIAIASAALVSAYRFEESFKFRFLTAFIPLYSRLRREEVLDNEIRGMIRGYVLANPGDHFAAIRKALGLKNGTLAYHLTVLEKENIVKSMRDGKFRRFFPSEMRILETSFPSKIEEMILEIIRDTPGITVKDIASVLGVSSPTASYHIGKLKEMDLVRAEREGMSVRHYLNKGP